VTLETAVELVETRGGIAQLCVLRGGQVLLDRSFGCRADSLFWIFSASKPYTAILVHLLAERGQLDLDAPVAAYWPEFARDGKESITVRHVLQHRSGLTTAGSAFGDALVMTDWQRSLRRIERTRPRWPAGAVPAYQFLAYGFILGEVVQRVTGRPFRDVLSAELLTPLGVRDTYLGLPVELWPRAVPVQAPGPAGGRRPVPPSCPRPVFPRPRGISPRSISCCCVAATGSSVPRASRRPARRRATGRPTGT
jgi:CubicO group peptidase (beta-lactamase class C family)